MWNWWRLTNLLKVTILQSNKGRISIRALCAKALPIFQWRYSASQELGQGAKVCILKRQDQVSLHYTKRQILYTWYPDLKQVASVCQIKLHCQGNHFSHASLSMLTWQVSQKKNKTVISLPGKELDNTHLSSFHMVLVLTVWNKYVRHQTLSDKKSLRTSWILFFDRKLNPKIGVSLEQRYFKPLMLELFGQLSPMLTSDLNRQFLNWFTSSLASAPLMLCCLESICYSYFYGQLYTNGRLKFYFKRSIGYTEGSWNVLIWKHNKTQFLEPPC